MNRILFGVALIGAILSLSAEEVSVFGAGDLGNSQPYGLTSKESAIFQNQQKVESVEERIQGLQTIVEGLNQQIVDLKNRVADLEIRAGTQPRDQNKNAIPPQNPKKNSSEVNQASPQATSQNRVEQTQKADDFKSMSNVDISKQADELFKNKKLDDAKTRYEYLVSKKFQPARTTFMLGEIHYFQKSYATAIKSYQQSISIKDSADYTPRLLFHTAISFDKIGDAKSANKFYSALKAAYPDSKEAKDSPNRK